MSPQKKEIFLVPIITIIIFLVGFLCASSSKASPWKHHTYEEYCEVITKKVGEHNIPCILCTINDSQTISCD